MDAAQEDNVVTMVDVLKEEAELDDAAGAVLSGSDDTKCTHLDGYVKRQALYSCMTCVPEARKNPQSSIGICLGCSLSCHESHELIELYTKRLFRCDCGVKRGSVKCQLDFSKKFPGTESAAPPPPSSSSSAIGANSPAQPNERNKYNQNFSGTYCTCHRPYPDDEENTDESQEMIVCVICEDWFHDRHLGTGKTPDTSAYAEMICDACMGKHEFLQDYVGLAVSLVDPEESRCDSTLNVTSLDESSAAANDDDDGGESERKKIKLSDEACVRPKLSINDKEKSSVNATFWKEGWRKNLCKCPACLNMYEKSHVQYLLDEEDTIHYYEQQGKSKRKQTSYDSSLQALSSLSHANQIDAISGYNRMKAKLFEYLQTFVNNNQIVTDDDIKRFFRTMRESNEGQQQQSVHQPHCR